MEEVGSKNNPLSDRGGSGVHLNPLPVCLLVDLILRPINSLSVIKGRVFLG